MKQSKKAKLQDFVEVSSNPFDQGKSIVGLGNKKPKIPYQRERQKEILLKLLKIL